MNPQQGSTTPEQPQNPQKPPQNAPEDQSSVENPPKKPTYTYTPPTEEPDFDFKTADIGVKTAVKNQSFAKETIKKAPTASEKLKDFTDQLAKIPANFKASATTAKQNIKENALFRTKTRKIATLAISLLVITGAVLAFLYLKNTNNTPPAPQKTPEQLTKDLLKDAKTAYEAGGDGYIDRPLRAITNQIRAYNNSNQGKEALKLGLEANWLYREVGEYQEAYNVLKSIDDSKLSNPDKYEYYLQMVSIANKLKDEKLKRDYLSKAEEIPQVERGLMGPE